MTVDQLTILIRVGGCIHLSILAASSLVPFRLNWKEDLKPLSPLHRQMYWTYGGYVVMAIVAFGVISLIAAPELASRGLLARCLCTYIFVFWFIRLGLQFVFDVKVHLTAWWLTWGYRLLTVLFLCLAAIYGWAAFGPMSTK